MKEDNEEEIRDSGLPEYNIEGQEPDAGETSAEDLAKTTKATDLADPEEASAEETSAAYDTLATSEPEEEDPSGEDLTAPKPPKKHHAYLWLWLLVSLSIIVVMAVSFLEEPTLFGLEVKQAPFRDALLAEAQEDTAASDTLPVATPEVVETDSTPKNILIFGDSMTFLLAQRMAKYGTQNGHTVYGVNWDSSTPQIWATSDTIAHFIRKYDISYVMVSLGSNELFAKDLDSRAKYVRQIVDKLGDIPFIWVGPPNWKEDNGYNDMLERTLPRGTFFRTGMMQLERRGDHIHPTPAAAVLWVDSIMRWMPKSAHPILVNLPADSINTTPTLTILKKKR